MLTLDIFLVWLFREQCVTRDIIQWLAVRGLDGSLSDLVAEESLFFCQLCESTCVMNLVEITYSGGRIRFSALEKAP